MTAAGQGFHEPVMVDEVLDLLDPVPDGLYLDGTVGGGGHAEALLDRCAGCELIAVDRDPDAVAEARARLERFGDRVQVEAARFDRALEVTGLFGSVLDGVLLDLGLSSHQIDQADRGFAFARGTPLDMRMGQDREARPTAAELLNRSGEEELDRIFRSYGEEPRARTLAREVIRRREQEPFETSDHLVAAIAGALGRRPTQRDKARIFQALRIAVNEEMTALDRALPSLRESLRPGGVFVVLSYHSLEDREVKHAFREWSRACVCPPDLPVCRCRGEALGQVLTRSPLRPSESEVARNPRARSARLRAWRKAPSRKAS